MFLLILLKKCQSGKKSSVAAFHRDDSWKGSLQHLQFRCEHGGWKSEDEKYLKYVDAPEASPR